MSRLLKNKTFVRPPVPPEYAQTRQQRLENFRALGDAQKVLPVVAQDIDAQRFANHTLDQWESFNVCIILHFLPYLW